MEDGSPFIFRNYTELDLEEHKTVLQARNHTEVRRWMTHKDPILLTDHLNYIEFLKASGENLYFAAFNEGTYCGSVSLTGLSSQKPYFGYFSSPHLFGTKNGIKLYYYGLSFLILKFQFENVFGLIFKENKKALKLGLKFGFTSLTEYEHFIEISRPTLSWPLYLKQHEVFELLLRKSE